MESMCRNEANQDSCDDELAGTCPCPLKLVTMAGNEIHTVVPVSIHHNWEMLEDYLIEQLCKSCGLDTFGCELTLLKVDTLRALCDPIHEELWDNDCFHLVIQDCRRTCCSKEQIRRDVYEDHPKAIGVPINESGTLPAKAFFSITRLRRVQVEAGFHTIDRQAWRYCHSLTIVKSPSSVVAVEYAAFQGCYALTAVATSVMYEKACGRILSVVRNGTRIAWHHPSPVPYVRSLQSMGEQ